MNKKVIIILGLLVFISLCIFTISGCGALVGLVTAIFGSESGFVFVPFLGEGKIAGSASVSNIGMIVLSHNTPPSGYHGASGATVYIEGYPPVKTGQDGSFTINGLPLGLKILHVEYDNFAPITQEVVISDPNLPVTSFTNYKMIPQKVFLPVGIGGVIEFTAYGEASSTNFVKPPTRWDVVNDIGTIDQNGVFTATKPGQGIIVATSGTNTARVGITVVDGTGTVQGKVTFKGSPAANVTVSVDGITEYVLTDKDGNYILPGVPATSVLVISTSGTNSGSANVTVPKGGTVTADITLPVSGTPGSGQPGSSPTPTLPVPVGNIQGKIYEYDGNTPITNAFVAFYSYSYPASRSIVSQSVPNVTTTSDSKGNYSFTGVPQGACRIEFWRCKSDHDANPGCCLGAAESGVVNGTNIVDVKSGVAPTATPTATPTITLVPTSSVPLPQMVSITGGTYQMGSNLAPAEQPIHTVTLSSFNMCKYTVTNTEYCRFLNSQGNQSEGGVTWINIIGDQYQGITGGPNPGNFAVVSGYENRPVVYVTWYGSVAYCNWLSSQHGYTACYGPINNRGNDPSVWRTLNGYRLPTEAERQYACRAGSITDYYWGENYNNPPGSPLNIGNYCWYNGNSGGNHHNVGTKLPNAWGLYDMSGNVIDWCNDWNGNYPAGPVTDPTGPVAGTTRVNQGGSWFNGTWNSHSGNRGPNLPTHRIFDVSFRLCRTP